MATKVLIVRHPGIRRIEAGEVLTALPPEVSNLPRVDHEVDTMQFSPQIEQDDWAGQSRFLAQEAAAIHEQIDRGGEVETHYFGIPEVPHAIAIGAFLGDERPVVLHDWDREAKSWKWPKTEQSIRVESRGLPTGEPIGATGSVVLRVEISFPISDEDVRQVIGTNHLAEVRVVHAEGTPPEICKVQSLADLEMVRKEIRRALAALRMKFPNYETIHVFAAAPVSVCVALGQELKPRNMPPATTFRYRKVDGGPAYKAALEISSRVEAEVESPLTEEERELAGSVRKFWREALHEMDEYLTAMREEEKGKTKLRWFESLSTAPLLKVVRPFPPLPRATEVCPRDAKVADEPVAREYSITTHDKTWHLSDRLLVAFNASVGGDPNQLKRLIRLFLFHEYLHEFHSLTKLRAPDVGTFANCLEFIDYTADVYALLHQLDLERKRSIKTLETDKAQLELLVEQVRLVIASFWAFERKPPIREMQIRRLRRYLNWYWRLVQLEVAPDLETALWLLGHPPQVEIGGLHQYSRPRRLWLNLGKTETGSRLELAVVLENLKLLRITDSTTANLGQLMEAFQRADSQAIVKFFRTVLEEARDKGGDLYRP
jgi:hypothetical protein